LIAAYNALVVSDFTSIATFTLILLPLLKNPNTNMKINGKAILNTTAEGLLKVDRKLAFDMESMALN
jgi:hypothetical protein